MSKLIIVSNRLPLTIDTEQDQHICRQSSGGLISAVTAFLNIGGRSKFSQVVWAGVPGCSEHVWKSVMECQAEMDYIFQPVFLNWKTYELYYNGFANSLIWPLFHYFPSFADYNEVHYEAYIKANQLFANALSETIGENDTVWIHDYHLLPLAAMLRKEFPKLSIGLFLHIPFPSYEIFRVIPKQWQRVILEGMLGADLVGFHTADYVAHFLTCVNKVLKPEYDGRYVFHNNMRTVVSAFPIGIDFHQFNSVFGHPEVVSGRERYKAIAKDKKFIFSVDRLDYTKGISNRLRGYERFLVENPEYMGKVHFALNIVPSRDSILKYAERKKMIDEYIGNVNSRLGSIEWQPVLYQYAHLSFYELIALYTVCDVALITPLRDGMNLVCKEFVASRKDMQGVLVLSEMAGAAEELPDALQINPNDTSEIAQMIKCALEMSKEEQAKRMENMQQLIKSYDVVRWASDFFQQLENAKMGQLDFEVEFINSTTRSALLNSYRDASKRLLLLDYDGSLVGFYPYPHLAIPSEDVIATLAKLAEDVANDVYIISGRDSAALQGWFGHLPIGLISEHGARIKHKNGNWHTNTLAGAGEWMAGAEKIMSKYVTEVPHSFIEKKDFSIVWHYRNVNSPQVNIIARQVHDDLVVFGARNGLSILNGNKAIEAKNAAINKGAAAQMILGNKEYDFVIAVGDDETDEAMFKELARAENAYTIKVGNAASFARYNLHNPTDVLSLLNTFATTPLP